MRTPKSKTYEEFVEKFKPKKTTDDCYTPESIYQAVAGWAAKKYGRDPKKFIRPFWPGDFRMENYPEGCTVVDNPPFSILAEIQKFYLEKEIKFFLFAPELTAFSGKDIVMRVNHIFADCGITYQNGANVRTAFVTNLDDGIVAETAPDLAQIIAKECDRLKKAKTKQLPKYQYPDEVVTAAMLGKWAKHGVNLKVRAEDAVRISALDEQKETGKAIFGGGLLLSERAAAERAAAERTAAERTAVERAAARKWQLSEREKEIVKGLEK